MDSPTALLLSGRCGIAACRLYAALWLMNGEKPGPLPLMSTTQIADLCRSYFPCSAESTRKALANLSAAGALSSLSQNGTLSAYSLREFFRDPGKVGRDPGKVGRGPENSSGVLTSLLNSSCAANQTIAPQQLNKTKLTNETTTLFDQDFDAANAANWKSIHEQNEVWRRIRAQVAWVLWVPDIRREVIDRATLAVLLKLTGASKTEYSRFIAEAYKEQRRSGKPLWASVNLYLCRLFESNGWLYPGTVPGSEPKPSNPIRTNSNERNLTP